MAGYNENLGQIEQIVPLGEDGFVVVPNEVIDSTSLRIKNMPPNEVFYATGNTSVLHDQHVSALAIDTRDFIAPLPVGELQVMSNPALMRIIKVMGDKVVDGFLVDYRRIRFPYYRDFGLRNGIDSERFQNFQTNYGTVLPLASVFSSAGNVKYHGPEELVEDTKGMMAAVDAYLASVASKLYSFDYSLPATIVRPPKPVIEELVAEVDVPPAAPVATSDIAGTLLLGAVYGVANSVLGGLTRRPEEQQ